jgi:hypothetical protein
MKGNRRSLKTENGIGKTHSPSVSQVTHGVKLCPSAHFYVYTPVYAPSFPSSPFQALPMPYIQELEPTPPSTLIDPVATFVFTGFME